METLGQMREKDSCLSLPSVATAPNLCTTRMPELTRPKMVCLLSRKGVGARVMKNWEPGKRVSFQAWSKSQIQDVPFVFGPELAMANIPAPTKRSSGFISSSLSSWMVRTPYEQRSTSSHPGLTISVRIYSFHLSRYQWDHRFVP